MKIQKILFIVFILPLYLFAQYNESNANEITSPPGWLEFIPYATVLTIETNLSNAQRVDFGQNLISVFDYASGEGHYQIYYSLTQIEISYSSKNSVLAVCGGSGEPLEANANVVVGPRVSIDISRKISILIKAIDLRYQDVIINKEAAEVTGNEKYIERSNHQIKVIKDLARHLRAAIIKSVSEEIMNDFEV